jgi:hypothetical protein
MHEVTTVWHSVVNNVLVFFTYFPFSLPELEKFLSIRVGFPKTFLPFKSFSSLNAFHSTNQLETLNEFC